MTLQENDICYRTW